MTKVTLSEVGGGRNAVIDILRLVFALLIVAYHGRLLFSNTSFQGIFYGCWIGVEFFFVVSGYLMVASAVKSKKKTDLLENPQSLGSETLQFLWRKFKKLIPYVIIGITLGILCLAVADNYSFTKTLEVFVYSIPQYLLIFESGIYVSSLRPDAPVWYLSALLIAMLIIYPILRRNIGLFTKVIAPILFLTSIGYLYATYGTLCLSTKWDVICAAGLIRAIGEISLGCFCYAAVEKLSSINFGLLGKTLLTSLAVGGYLVVIFKAVENIDKFSCIALLLLSVSVTITFSKKGLITPLFEKINLSGLATFTMVLYLCHYSIRVLFTSGFIFGEFDPVMKFVAYVVTSLILSGVIYGLVNYAKGLLEKVPLRYKNLFVIK